MFRRISITLALGAAAAAIALLSPGVAGAESTGGTSGVVIDGVVIDGVVIDGVVIDGVVIDGVIIDNRDM